MDFNPVVFEHLVDLPLPPIGENPCPKITNEISFSELIHSKPPSTVTMGDYLQVLMPVHIEVQDSYPAEQIKPEFGNYHSGRRTVPFSKELVSEFGMYYCGSGYFVFSEECFGIIARYLDLDYYAIAKHDLQRVTLDQIRGRP